MPSSEVISIPGGWEKEAPPHASYDEIENASEEDLATGLVDETGNVVNTTGKTVGKITEGKPDELVGDIVTATGSVLAKSGEAVGKAVPLQGEGKPSAGEDVPKRGGWAILGTVKSVGGLLGNVNNTVQTATKPVGNLVGGLGEAVGGTAQGITKPIGGLTKGLGLGGGEKGSETSESEPVDIKPEDALPEKAGDATQAAKEDVPADTDGPAEAVGETSGEAGENSPHAPIDLQDNESEIGATSMARESHITGKCALETGTPATSERIDVSKEDGLQSIDNPENSVVKDGGDDEKAGTSGEPCTRTEDVTSGPKQTEHAPEPIGDKDMESIDENQDKTQSRPDETRAGEALGEITGENEERPGEDKDKLNDAEAEIRKVGEDDEAVAVPSLESEAGVPASPFERFDNPIVGEDGRIIADDQSIGRVIEGDAASLKGKQVEKDGNIIDETGSVVGKAKLKTELAEEDAVMAVDYSVLKNCKANKLGNIVNEKGEVVGHITQGILKNLIGKKCDEQGQFWSDNGKVIGKAEPIPENERSEFKEPAPFEDFPDATVQSNGDVVSGGEVIGKVVEGNAKALKGKKVDDDGDILDRSGNVLGHAERWEEPEAEPEPEKDRSILAGKRVNKAGNVVDSSGQIFGRVIEGDAKRLVGRMCDKEGNIRSESGDIIGKAEVVPEGEREGFKDGPFAELPGCTVAKDGKVVTPAGDVVGRLISGDAKVLFGRAVDEDGDVLDRNGNSIGKAERWEEPVVEKKKGPMAGRKINREGNVVDEDGNLIGKLTTGELSICSGKEIDDDGDVVDSKGRIIGHASLLSEIPPEPEPTESEEDRKAREQAEEDKKLAARMATCIEQCLDKIRPICKMITQKIDKAERTPKEDLDEEDLVKQVKPLIEEGGRILNESNGIIRGLDPDGRIQAKAKHRSASREATPEEYHLADVLKELTGTVTECIEGAKRKIEDMPHAKKELNPLWGLLTEPLFQILAAVGLLLNGVLALVGRLLSGLGLGGLIDNLLGGLGLTRLLEGLGLGSVTKALTGKDKKKK